MYFIFFVQGFGTTPSPATPSHGYNAPYTPSTPMSNVFGGDSGYSPMHTPSPMHGNPLTPGAGLGPLSPAYTPQTPMGQYEEGLLFLNDRDFYFQFFFFTQRGNEDL